MTDNGRSEPSSNIWTLADAEARFSEIIDRPAPRQITTWSRPSPRRFRPLPTERLLMTPDAPVHLLMDRIEAVGSRGRPALRLVLR